MGSALRHLISDHGVPIADLEWDTFEPADVAHAESSEPLRLDEWFELLEAPVDPSYPGVDNLQRVVDEPGKLNLLAPGTPRWAGKLSIGPDARQPGYATMERFTGVYR